MSAVLIDFATQRPVARPTAIGASTRIDPGMVRQWQRQEWLQRAAGLEARASRFQSYAAKLSTSPAAFTKAKRQLNKLEEANYAATLALMLTPAVTIAGLEWKIRHIDCLKTHRDEWRSVLDADAARLDVPQVY